MIADSLIIGSGVIGLSLAWELVQRGQHVIVLESGEFAKGASWAGAGILPPTAKNSSPDSHEQLRSLGHQLHPEWSDQLKIKTGIDNEYQRCGGIYLARSAVESATLVGNQVWWQEHDIEFQQLTPAALSEKEHSLREICGQIKSAWLLPDECQLRNPRHLNALLKACSGAGVKLLDQHDVLEIQEKSQALVQVRCGNGNSYEARQVCICSGAWARKHLESFGLESGIMPIRGQMLLYDLGTQIHKHVINEGNRYLVCRKDGHLLAGSIEEEVGYKCETTAEGINKIKGWAESLLPQLKQHSVKKSWAGLRPGSYDSLPYLGRLPNRESIYLAAGHFRSGLHLSCATAVCMADLMLGQTPPIDLYPFRVGRG